MFLNADDKGFVDNAFSIIESLEKNDKEFDKNISLELLENTYRTGLNELLSRGYLYEFRDNHSNSVFLIRHWYFHNEYYTKAWTNYKNYLKKVKLMDNKYVWRTRGEQTNGVYEEPTNDEEPVMTWGEIMDNFKDEDDEPHKSREELLKELGGDED